ncbi:MAG: Malonyl CoA-acyl carrier protein transacylase, partial [Verrucomicrobiales bacterium]|nr:Malonyl CoA-acyl carrier protein transacylase [Verrucomicrobiales bacterium]
MNKDSSTSAMEPSMPDLRQLLAARLMQGGGRLSGNPLSSAQQRLWFLDQLEPNSPIYNIPSVGRLKGRLDLDALRNAINVIAKRHEALRTRFSNEDGEPCQVVDEGEIGIGMEDLSGISEPEREQVINRKVQEEIRRPFSLSTEQLIRINLLRLAPEDHVLIINIHHIISDEWSLKIFFKEFIELYTGYVEGRNVSLPDLP